MGSLARKLARNSLEYSPRLQRDKVIKRMKKLNDDVCNRDLPVWVRMAAYQELRGLKGTMRIKRMGNKKNNGLIYGFHQILKSGSIVKTKIQGNKCIS